MSDIEQFKSSIKDYLTFYHEIRVPKHDFFTSDYNIDENNKVLAISSPSRMGNHLILSMIDNHPEIPRIPGEDGFLLFSFIQANYDLHNFLHNLLKEKNIDYIMKLGTNLTYNKWLLFKNYFLTNEIPENHSGIDSLKAPAKIDYQGLIHDINYDAYKNVIKSNLEDLNNNQTFSTFFNVYLKALVKLDFDYKPNNYSYDSVICASGMRSQLKWLFDKYKNSKAIISLRPFGSYAISHIKSRYQTNEITDALIKEAWEHWYHKIIDAYYLKVHYPENTCLVSFEDLIFNTETTAQAIAKFLNIKFNKNMYEATIFGIKVRGNSSVKKDNSSEGKFYFNNEKLDENNIPVDYYRLWESFDLIKTA